MKQQVFHHALKVNYDICYGCTRCLNACPTEAIRIQNGKAIISEHKCIDCGKCFNACPVHAINVEQDDFNTIFNYEHRVILYPSVLIGQLSHNYSIEKIIAAIHELGFNHAFEVEHGADFIAEEIKTYQQENENNKPLISAFCPAIIRLIQVKFPSLVNNIIHRKAPLDIASIFYRKKLEDQGIKPEDIGIFYITPCAAKIAAVKSPVGEDRSSIDGVINMETIYNRIQLILRNNKDIAIPHDLEKPQFSSENILWSLTNGEVDHFGGRCLAIDEIHNAIEFLEKLEMGDIDSIDFVEIRACDESCAGGILNVENRFLTVEQMRKRSKRQADEEKTNKIINPIYKYKEYIQKLAVIKEIPPRSMVKMDEDISKAIIKLEKARRMMSYLPCIDCGICGAPSCSALSEDIVQGKASLSDCFFIRGNMQNSRTLTPQKSMQIIEKIWGKAHTEKKQPKQDDKQ